MSRRPFFAGLRRGRPGADPEGPHAFVDLHCHFLPGVDDGAASVDETLAMLRLAHRGGTRRILATPHLFHPAFPPLGAAEIRERFARLAAELAERAGEPSHRFLREIEIGLGAEHHVSPELLAALENSSVLPLNGGCHLLLELSDLLTWPTAQAALARVREAGFVPVLAHVERFPVFQSQPGRLAAARETGCLAQVNADSVLGQAGRGPRRASRTLLKRGLVDVVASDGHRPAYRPPDLRGAFEHLARRYEKRQVSSWLTETPARVLGSGGAGR